MLEWPLLSRLCSRTRFNLFPLRLDFWSVSANALHDVCFQRKSAFVETGIDEVVCVIPAAKNDSSCHGKQFLDDFNVTFSETSYLYCIASSMSIFHT